MSPEDYKKLLFRIKKIERRGAQLANRDRLVFFFTLKSLFLSEVLVAEISSDHFVFSIWMSVNTGKCRVYVKKGWALLTETRRLFRRKDVN